jgi:hypothetical protein
MKRFLANLLAVAKRSAHRHPSLKRERRAHLRVESLEDRLVLSPIFTSTNQRFAFSRPDVSTRTWIKPEIEEGIPSLSSRPAAPATLYLDFLDGLEKYWGNHGNTNFNNVTTSHLDIDHDGSLSSARKTAFVTEVYQRVSEMFSPFNLNVTTVDPGHYEHGKVMVLHVGDTTCKDGDPLGGAPGISFTGGFTDSTYPNVAFVEPSRLSGNAKLTAVAIAHEAGHMLGLDHQSSWNKDGTFNQEYNPGDAASAPIMGKAYHADRALWWKGPTDHSATTIQSDLDVITRNANGFGYSEDGIGHSVATATDEGSAPGASFNGDGVISRTDRADYYRFSITRAGNLSLNLAVADTGPMLHAKVLLLNASGTTVASASSPTSLGASLTTNNLAPGQYTVEVVSYGGYGDLGTYHLAVTCGSPLTDLRGALFTFQATFAPNQNLVAGQLTITGENLYTGSFTGTFVSVLGGLAIAPVHGRISTSTTSPNGTPTADIWFSGAAVSGRNLTTVSYSGKVTGKGHAATGWNDVMDGTLFTSVFGARPTHAKDD